MKQHHILISFNGSQTGADECQFEAGTTAALSDSLAAVVVPEGWAEPVAPDVLAGGPHPKLIETPEAPNELVEHRETKVTGPTETKPAAPTGKKKR